MTRAGPSPADRSMPNLVASCTSPLRPPIAPPTRTSLVTPASSAVRIVAMDSSQSVAPYHSLIPMQPRPWAETVRSPSLVVRIRLPLLRVLCVLGARFANLARVGVDLRVEQLEGFPLRR